MNIFVLDTNPVIAASFYIDKHCVKMPLEIAQLLSTTHNLVNINGEMAPYKTTHQNHPCSKWIRESIDNWLWLVEHGLAVSQEYTKRYGKVHKSQAVIEWCFANVPNLPDIGLTPFAQAMPDDCKNVDAVEAYRTYYRVGKESIATWKTCKPYWY